MRRESVGSDKVRGCKCDVIPLAVSDELHECKCDMIPLAVSDELHEYKCEPLEVMNYTNVNAT
jgi:hypothetical protein